MILTVGRRTGEILSVFNRRNQAIQRYCEGRLLREIVTNGRRQPGRDGGHVIHAAPARVVKQRIRRVIIQLSVFTTEFTRRAAIMRRANVIDAASNCSRRTASTDACRTTSTWRSYCPLPDHRPPTRSSTRHATSRHRAATFAPPPPPPGTLVLLMATDSSRN